MNTRFFILLLSLSLLSMTPAYPADSSAVDFVRHVKPVLISRCINCHHTGTLLGELSLESRAMAFKKRVNGPVILPGKPDSSMLYIVLKLPAKNPKAMPAAGHRVTDKEIEIIYDWIKQGAEWPEGDAGVLKPTPSRNNREF
jgi:mono/diheme cytochrome c family protein